MPQLSHKKVKWLVSSSRGKICGRCNNRQWQRKMTPSMDACVVLAPNCPSSVPWQQTSHNFCSFKKVVFFLFWGNCTVLVHYYYILRLKRHPWLNQASLKSITTQQRLPTLAAFRRKFLSVAWFRRKKMAAQVKSIMESSRAGDADNVALRSISLCEPAIAVNNTRRLIRSLHGLTFSSHFHIFTWNGSPGVTSGGPKNATADIKSICISPQCRDNTALSEEPADRLEIMTF